jgi:hypothetical protein
MGSIELKLGFADGDRDFIVRHVTRLSIALIDAVGLDRAGPRA